MLFRNELHYITPIENVASIMEHGLLSYESAACIHHQSVAMNVVQQRRDGIKVPNGLRLHQYVNLYFDARNPMLYSRKEQVDTLCVLKINPGALNLANVVIADRNASSIDYVSFKSSPGGLDTLDFETIYCENWDDPDMYRKYYKKSTKCAEVLVPHCLPPSYIDGAYVGSQKAYNCLYERGFSLTIIPNPKLFFRE